MLTFLISVDIILVSFNLAKVPAKLELLPKLLSPSGALIILASGVFLLHSDIQLQV
jgi:hypothetical protein